MFLFSSAYQPVKNGKFGKVSERKKNGKPQNPSHLNASRLERALVLTHTSSADGSRLDWTSRVWRTSYAKTTTKIA